MRHHPLAAICFITLTTLVACKRAGHPSDNAPPQRVVETIDHYEILAPGDEVLDTRSRLIWTRCALGEVWNGTSCDGMAREVTRAEAQQATPDGWRIPSIRELASLIHCSSGRFRGKTDVGDGLPPLDDTCVHGSEPALHPVFVARQVDLIHSMAFWTVTPVGTNGQYIHIIMFRQGQLNGTPTFEDNEKLLVRFVRDAEGRHLP